ncbi:NUDIX hydrolase [Fibrisoma montanum]|uniref:NUDIX hydrolase n=1 Tax=Fibrisoma montanum TaxID=2305895 RepID=A0A418MJA1_9BACT|nr:NUDIX hydrolase [Fibrisoma montanum]RIV27575.1 NUDIX hydrolase [Fibrisoma montanum]
MKVRPSALIWRSTQLATDVLLMHYRYGGHDVFALPGGNPDRNETLPQTVTRELQEELGVTADVGTMVLAGEMLLSQRNDDVLHVVFAASNLQGEPVLNPAETSAIDLVWKPLDELDRLNLYPNVGLHIQRWFNSAIDLGYVGRIEQAYFD